MRDFDMSEAWRQMVAMFQANRDVLLTLTGLFFFVPSLLMSLMAVEPPQGADTMGLQETLAQLQQYFIDTAPWLLLIFVVSGLGSLAIFRLLLAPGGTSLGSALSVAAALLVPYLLGAVLAGVAIGWGFLLFIVPGLYLHARLSLLGPTMAAEHKANPLQALQSSWNATRNNGWTILLFIMVVSIVGLIALVIGDAIFGTLFALALPEKVANISGMVVEALLGAGLSLATLLLSAAVYRQLGHRDTGETFR